MLNVSNHLKPRSASRQYRGIPINSWATIRCPQTANARYRKFELIKFVVGILPSNCWTLSSSQTILLSNAATCSRRDSVLDTAEFSSMLVSLKVQRFIFIIWISHHDSCVKCHGWMGSHPWLALDVIPSNLGIHIPCGIILPRSPERRGDVSELADEHDLGYLSRSLIQFPFLK